MTFKPFIFLLMLGVLVSCSKIEYLYIPTQSTPVISKKLNEEELEDWSSMDVLKDSIPGISLDKALNTIIKTKEEKQVIVAVIDKGIDIYHQDLKNHIWINSKEIPNNGIDDDGNNYVDDINGWNFSGNKAGESSKYTHNDYVRIVKAYDSMFKVGQLQKISLEDSLKYITYKRAKKRLNKRLESVSEDIEYAENVYKWKGEAKQILSQYYDITNFDLKKLDSLKMLHPKDSTIQLNIKILSGFIANGYTDDFIEGLKLKSRNLLSKQLNINYNEREITKDNPEDITDKNYGNSNVNSDINFFFHGTIIAGIIPKNTPQIKIMSLCLSGFGSKNDKDIALAIRYAVDNGAKVINMSFVKQFSLHLDWVNDAIKYAEKNNVLIIQAAGNSSENMDNPNSFNYPDDRDSKGNEFVSNFIKVGGSTHMPNENLKYDSSSYGSINVDIFAPSEKIYTTFPNNEYKYDTGTSLASAITSKVAALLFSYYPNLTAAQVKQIIMDSGVEYTFPVKTPTTEDKNKMTPFNELSKSGKIVNAYNALIMADSISSKVK